MEHASLNPTDITAKSRLTEKDDAKNSTKAEEKQPMREEATSPQAEKTNEDDASSREGAPARTTDKDKHDEYDERDAPTISEDIRDSLSDAGDSEGDGESESDSVPDVTASVDPADSGSEVSDSRDSETSDAVTDSVDAYPSSTQMMVVKGLSRPGAIATTFRWAASALGGREVLLTGSFIGWNRAVRMLRNETSGDFILTLPLPAGRANFKFVVDGMWRISPSERAARDALGELNNIRDVTANATVHWDSSWAGKDVLLTGSFNGWQELLPLTPLPGAAQPILADADALQGSPMERVRSTWSPGVADPGLNQGQGPFAYPPSQPSRSLSLCLPPGPHAIQFLVDGAWRTAPDLPVDYDEAGFLCNRLEVQPGQTFHLAYATGWEAGALHYRVAFEYVDATNEDGADTAFGGGGGGGSGNKGHHAHDLAPTVFSNWNTARLVRCNARDMPAGHGSHWMDAVIPVPECPPVVPPGARVRPSLEFYIERHSPEEAAEEEVHHQQQQQIPHQEAKGGNKRENTSASASASASSSAAAEGAAATAGEAAVSTSGHNNHEHHHQQRAGPGSENRHGRKRDVDRPQHGAIRHGSRARGRTAVQSSDGGQPVYRLPHPGGYRLSGGTLLPFPRLCEAPVLVVSDLDGTMVGEGSHADAGTVAFTTYWERGPALAGSRLVYNTGRSIGQFEGLLEYKKGALAVPDAVITAVGTKVFLRDLRVLREEGHPNPRDMKWVEDQGYAQRLNEGWNLDVVRQEGGRCVDKYSGQCAWLDDGSEHPHRIALSVAAGVAPDVAARLRTKLHEKGVEAQLVFSGDGEWRYLDVLAKNAGKYNAMEYVRNLFGISRDRTVACGDSGNDVLMLEGPQRSICVGNSQPQLVAWLLSRPQREAPIVLTDQHYAYGILEGLARHGLY